MTWPKEKAKAVAKSFENIRGCNFITSTCANPTAFWQDFDEKQIDKELGWAENIGLNSIRVFMQYLVFEAAPDKFLQKFKMLLDIASKHFITVMPVFFDDCWGPEPMLGKQPDPIPGVHNSRWTQSPGISRTKFDYWQNLKKYVVSVISKFDEDKRVIAWDMYNEVRKENTPLLEAAFSWAYEIKPQQPLVTCWSGEELQDIITFHNYGNPESDEFKKAIEDVLRSGRPVVCTECMARTTGSTLDKLIPVFEKYKIGWYVWGLVSGATQTRFPWGWPAGGPEPYVWFHDLLYPDGRPYNEHEIKLIKKAAGKV